jgi:hypothetical protein
MNNKKLHTIKNSGFKVPKGYFESLDDNVLGKLKANFNLRDIKSNSFKTPDDYFETFDEKLFKSLETETKVRHLITWKQLTYISGIAASFLIFFNLYFSQPKNVNFDSLETASITNYLTEENFNTYELASLFSEDELTSDKFTEEPINESVLEEYLYENASIEDLIIE